MICHKMVDWRYGAYSCSTCPDYVVHSKCATRVDVWDGEELEGVPEETFVVSPFREIEKGLTIEHFSHKDHFLIKIDEEDDILDGSIRCEACVRPIFSETHFKCMQCECDDFFIHETCSNLPLRKRHWLSTKPFYLNANKDESKSLFRCDACETTSNGFKYESEGPEGVLSLDMRCAFVISSVSLECHTHTLFLTTMDRGTCGGCKVSEKYVLRCTESQCDFSLCLACATLPKKIKRKGDEHFLFLRHGEKASGKYWCEVCEAVLDPHEEWFYTCDVSGVTFHIKCVVGEFPNAKPGFTYHYHCVLGEDPALMYARYHRPVQGEKAEKIELVHNNRITRPNCATCGSRCLRPLILKLKLVNTYECVCCWEDRSKMFTEVEGIIRRQINMSVLPSVQPFHAIAYPIDPILALEISRKYAAHCSIIASRFGLPPFNHPAGVPVKREGGFKRLRIGYVSSDFGNHPLSHLMGSVFGMHNRENVEVFCYALSPNDGTEWRQRTQSEAEHFLDVSAMSSDAIAKTINEDKIQILINLNGYTKGARNEIFAMQPAPIQVSYMGFPGTTGATYIDYLVTDERSLSISLTATLSMITSRKIRMCWIQSLSPRDLTMDFLKINSYLDALTNYTKWILRSSILDAAAQGVHPDQIIFTDVAMKNEHIRRSVLADVILDTPLCNGHTTGTDVLWAGVPMITLPLEKMATRVAGSLCLATGLGHEMIVNSLEEYEEKAVSLALNKPKLQALTKELRASRLTCPLFDTMRWVKNLERSYFKMWNLHCSGQKPQHFKVVENDMEFPHDR
ncbi:hypothetical protein F2Q70_00037749 [Brassica cretica]|uniref:O-GlcNAc transferase C-terminal domain-containing protein n=1 Tax=Brassica cretica TaxID=69181 RepID=A0A8S9JSB7_BRACR|nr:hypothetical protein F2Q70_00037749 [Brassica cretica]